MKIIFTEDIKNKGKKYEVKDLPNGYANFLIKEGKAKLATTENLTEVDNIKKNELAEEAKLITKATEVKKELTGRVLTLFDNPRPDGSLQNPVTKKEVYEYLNHDYPYINDSKMIDMKVIKQFGKYSIPIKLYKNIKTEIELHILSKE